jgi:hypothetical protein
MTAERAFGYTFGLIFRQYFGEAAQRVTFVNACGVDYLEFFCYIKIKTNSYECIQFFVFIENLLCCVVLRDKCVNLCLRRDRDCDGAGGERDLPALPGRHPRHESCAPEE